MTDNAELISEAREFVNRPDIHYEHELISRLIDSLDTALSQRNILAYRVKAIEAESDEWEKAENGEHSDG